MKTSNYLDALKARHSLTSDYQIAKKLRMTSASISRYRLNKTTFDDSTALLVAELLEIDPLIVIADMNAIRSKTPETRAVWKELHDRLTGAAAAVLLGFVVIMGSAPAPIFADDLTTNTYYVK